MTQGTLRFLLTVLILGGTVIAQQRVDRRRPEHLALPLSSIEETAGNWHSVQNEALSAATLDQLRPTDYLSRTYQKQHWQAHVLITYFASQRAGESMHSPRVCLPGGGWEIWHQDTDTIETPMGTATINKYSIHKLGQRRLVFYWYQTPSRILHSEFAGKLLLLRDSALYGRTSGSLVRVTLPDVPGAREEGKELAALMAGRLNDCFRR